MNAPYPETITARSGIDGIDRDDLVGELLDTIGAAITSQPRSLQKRVGPSELGVECARRLGYRLAGAAEVNDRGPAWKPFIGTSVHSMLEEVFSVANAGQDIRWMTEQTVDVGTIGGEPVTGSCDLFDVPAGAVWDWKVTTRNMIREKYRPHGPGRQYRDQAHLYGRGMTRAGMTVRSVGIVFLTRDGELRDTYAWHEPYDETVAVAALERAEAVATIVAGLGPAAFEQLPTADAFCNHCPWYRPNAADLSTSCPGHPGRYDLRTDPIQQLIA